MSPVIPVFDHDKPSLLTETATSYSLDEGLLACIYVCVMFVCVDVHSLTTSGVI